MLDICEITVTVLIDAQVFPSLTSGNLFKLSPMS